VANLNDIVIFIKVAQFESFSVAAQSLGMPVSTVSRRISELEDALGVTLLQRTTRKLSLTAQGRDYFNECNEPLNILSDAERVLTQTQKKPEGSLKITVPVILREKPFLDFISKFLKNYPRINIDLFITNEFVDLIAENIDLAIRFGDLKDSTLIAKKIGTSIRYLVAAPEYLKGQKHPVELEDLKKHQCVLLNGQNGEAEWSLVSGKKNVSVRVSGPISSRDFHSVSFFTSRGHGIGLLPSTYCDDPINKGELVRLMPKWTSPQFDVYAVYPTRKFLPSRLHVFIDELKKWKNPLWIRTDSGSF
jgi:DNA-binding transcriptional LysR family regulator